MIGLKRTLASAFVAVVLVATAIASMWLMASSGVFSGAEQPLPSAPERAVTTVAGADSPVTSAALVASFQGAPRDPFAPLIDTPTGDTTGTTTDDETSTTTTTGGSDDTTTTTAGDGTTTTTEAATTTTVGDAPDGVRVALLEVREENGALVAVVEVDGETSTVGVGDTFSESFKVVSLTESGGVFTYGDSAFTLAVGQSILK
jgi:hypothetical protein